MTKHPLLTALLILATLPFTNTVSADAIPIATIQRSEPITFAAKEFSSDKRPIPRRLRVINNDTGSVDDGDRLF